MPFGRWFIFLVAEKAFVFAMHSHPNVYRPVYLDTNSFLFGYKATFSPVDSANRALAIRRLEQQNKEY